MTIKQTLDNLDLEKRWRYIFNYGMLLAEKNLVGEVLGLLFMVQDEEANFLAVEIQVENNRIVSIIYGTEDDEAFVSKYADELKQLIEPMHREDHQV